MAAGIHILTIENGGLKIEFSKLDAGELIYFYSLFSIFDVLSSTFYFLPSIP